MNVCKPQPVAIKLHYVFSPLAKEVLWVEMCLSSACDMPLIFSSKESVRLWSLTKHLSKVTCLSCSLLMSRTNKLVVFWRWFLSPSWSCIQDSLFSSTELLKVVISSWTSLRISLFIGCPKHMSMPDSWIKNARNVCSNLHLILNVFSSKCNKNILIKKNIGSPA